MHGIIFAELKNYVTTTYTERLWTAALNDANLNDRFYFTLHNYPDEEIQAIARAISNRAEVALPTLLHDFGLFIGPTMIKNYQALIKPAWRTLDLLEHTENTMHRIVTKQHGAHPPKLVVTRLSPAEAVINYTSHRKMCALAEGLVKAYAAHYGETVEVAHLSCMHTGDPECNISVKLIETT